MPELPEVEVYRRYVAARALHRGVRKVEVLDKRIVTVTPQMLTRSLKGKELTSTKRIGKYLLIEISSGKWLTMHFGMSGSLRYSGKGEDPPRYTQLVIHFEEGSHLAFVCPRKLERVGLTEGVREFIEEKRIGPNADALTLREFRELLRGRKGGIKAALMDQRALSGIGNVYADEILFQARIHPSTHVSDLDDDDVKRLHTKMRSVFRTAVGRRAKSENYPGTFLTRRRKKGERCPGCKGLIERIKVNGRSTYVCPSCQRL